MKNAGETPAATVSRYDVRLVIDLPADLDGVELTDERYEFKNISTGRTSTFDAADGIRLMTGLYDVTYTASARLASGNMSVVRAFTQSVQVTGPGTVVRMTAWHNMTSDDLVIAEVFFTGIPTTVTTT